jgi:hypothetical protein
LKNRILQFWQDRELWRTLGKTWGAERFKRDIDIIHIGSYHLENGILDISLRLETLSPTNSYTFGLDSSTWIKIKIFREIDSREEYNRLERHLFTNG